MISTTRPSAQPRATLLKMAVNGSFESCSPTASMVAVTWRAMGCGSSEAIFVNALMTAWSDSSDHWAMRRDARNRTMPSGTVSWSGGRKYFRSMP